MASGCWARGAVILCGLACAPPAAGQFTDCNTNGIHDLTEVEQGQAADCNTDSAPDECYLTAHGLVGNYYDNLDFSGTHVVRLDATVNFDWGFGPPTIDIGPDQFSVRWTGQVEAPLSQVYTFYTYTNDGVRLWVDGQLIIDTWIDQVATEWSGTIALTGGRRYDIRMEFYESVHVAIAQLRWQTPSIPKQIIPTQRLYPVTDCDDNGTPDACDLAAGAPDCNANAVPDACDARGDFDGDRQVDADDIAPFVTTLLGRLPSCDTLADLNGDGRVDGLDIAPFVTLLPFG